MVTQTLGRRTRQTEWPTGSHRVGPLNAIGSLCARAPDGRAAPKVIVRPRARMARGPAGSEFLKAADLDELLKDDAGASDEGTVDVRLHHDLLDVVRLHRAAVEDPDPVGDLGRVA